MSTVLFINGPASGHVYPTLGLVEELITEGEKVVYLSSEEFREKLERIGAVFVAYENFLLREDPFRTTHYLSLVIKLLSSYEVILPCVFELANRNTFDYIIHDSMYGCGSIVADFLGIPNVSTCTSFIHSEKLLTENRGNLVELKENLLLINEFISLSKRIRAKFDLQQRIDVKDVFFSVGKINLVYTSEFFQPQSEKLESHYKFIGPNMTNRNETIDFQLDCIRGRQTIYISMGTIFNDVEALYKLFFETLASFDGHVVLSIGNRIDMATLKDVPANFTVLSYVPQLQILAYTDLFITHGGMNSVNEALYYGIPLLVIPMAADQPIVGNRVVELGAGLMLNKHSLTSTQLRTSVEQLLYNDNYRINSSRIGESLRSAGGQKKAMEEIRKFKKMYKISNCQPSEAR